MNNLTTQDYFSEEAWSLMAKITKNLLDSGAMPRGIANGQQAMMILQAGKEMGLKPMESLNSLYLVNGSINLWGKGLVKRFREFGFQIQFSNESENGVTATVIKNEEKYIDTFTFLEAEQSGWTKDRSGGLKFGWSKGANRTRKLRYGVLSQIAHTYTPEVLGSAVGIVEISQDYMDASGELDLPVPKKIQEKRNAKFDLESKENIKESLSVIEDIKVQPESVSEVVEVENTTPDEALKKAQAVLDEKRKKLQEKAK